MANYYHKSMTQEKWNAYSKYQQILMVASELGRAKSWIIRQDYNEVSECYFRAIELLEMMISDKKWLSPVKELLRFKEVLGKAALFKNDDLNFCLSLYKNILTWDREAIKVAI